jgi:hypothetical protein
MTKCPTLLAKSSSGESALFNPNLITLSYNTIMESSGPEVELKIYPAA